MLAELGGLPELRSLRTLSKTATDAGLAALANHPNLRVLVVAGTRITDASAEVFASLDKLAALHLYNAKITTEGLAKIVAREPVELSLAHVALGDAMVPELKKLTSAKFVVVFKCKLSKPAVKGLEASLPSSFINHSMGDLAHCVIVEAEGGGWRLTYPDGYIHDNGVRRTNPVFLTAPA